MLSEEGTAVIHGKYVLDKGNGGVVGGLQGWAREGPGPLGVSVRCQCLTLSELGSWAEVSAQC